MGCGSIGKKKHDWEFAFFEWAIILFILGIVSTIFYFLSIDIFYAFMLTFWVSGVLCFIFFIILKGFNKVRSRKKKKRR